MKERKERRQKEMGGGKREKRKREIQMAVLIVAYLVCSYHYCHILIADRARSLFQLRSDIGSVMYVKARDTRS